ncbi:MAG: hypothetical protein CM1200mP10_20420 [Candidatus Neomarinimicrobiota bacterium]|nr:MAG: hypothetical protein CM1200mP10_20420 [Candidatus Neomarinimicrobiota bacterium]
MGSIRTNPHRGAIPDHNPLRDRRYPADSPLATSRINKSRLASLSAMEKTIEGHQDYNVDLEFGYHIRSP